MSELSENYPLPTRQEKCPDCGWEHMNIWENGRIHCGKCLMGGNITADKYKHLTNWNMKKGKIKTILDEVEDWLDKKGYFISDGLFSSWRKRKKKILKKYEPYNFSKVEN